MNPNSQTEYLVAQLEIETGKIRWLSASSDPVFFSLGIPVTAEQIARLNAASASATNGGGSMVSTLLSAKTTRTREKIMTDAVSTAFMSGLGHSLPLADVNGDEVGGVADLQIIRC